MYRKYHLQILIPFFSCLIVSLFLKYPFSVAFINSLVLALSVLLFRVINKDKTFFQRLGESEYILSLIGLGFLPIFLQSSSSFYFGLILAVCTVLLLLAFYENIYSKIGLTIVLITSTIIRLFRLHHFILI